MGLPVCGWGIETKPGNGNRDLVSYCVLDVNGPGGSGSGRQQACLVLLGAIEGAAASDG